MLKYRVVFKEKELEDLFVEAVDFHVSKDVSKELIFFSREISKEERDRGINPYVALVPLDHILSVSVVLEADSDEEAEAGGLTDDDIPF